MEQTLDRLAARTTFPRRDLQEAYAVLGQVFQHHAMAVLERLCNKAMKEGYIDIIAFAEEVAAFVEVGRHA